MSVLLSSSILETEYHIFHCEHYKTLTSTSDFLREQLEQNSPHMPEGTVIIADNQTGGHGRYGRKWIASKGNLNMSFLLHTHELIIENVPQLSYVLAIAVRNALMDIDANLSVSYKWPNDILVKGSKVAGLLLESSSIDEWIVLSVGVNMVANPSADEVAFPATNIKEASLLDVSREDMRNLILRHFSLLFHQWQQYGFVAIRNMWMEEAYGVGQMLRVEVDDKVYKGTFDELNESGELIISGDDGEKIRISSGDVFLG